MQCYCHPIKNDSVIEDRSKECEDLEEKYQFFKHLNDDRGFQYLTFLSDLTVIGIERNPSHIFLYLPINQRDINLDRDLHKSL